MHRFNLNVLFHLIFPFLNERFLHFYGRSSETAAGVRFELCLIYCWSSDPSGDGDHHWTNGGVWQPTEVHVWPGGGVRHRCNAGARPGPPEHGESSGQFDVTPERNHFIYLNPPKTAVKCQSNRWWSDYRSVGLQTANSLSAMRLFNSDGVTQMNCFDCWFWGICPCYSNYF